MKNIKIICLTALCLLLAATGSVQAQTRLRIGQKEIVLRSPFVFEYQDTTSKYFVRDTILIGQNSFSPKRWGYYKQIEEMYCSLLFPLNTTEQNYLPTTGGSSYSLDFGIRKLFRPSRYFAIGTFAQYSFYNFRVPNAVEDEIFAQNIQGNVISDSYRTDNIGTGILTRFYLYPRSLRSNLYVEAGVWGDFSYSKRYNVKTRIDGHKEKFKFRDPDNFNAFEAGLQARVNFSGFSIVCRYRLTDMFNHKAIPMELPRWSIGIQLSSL